ncbi:MAG: LytR C-terminal domain-containing protein [Galactobacter sp.]|mgnify:CR=1 FL=1|uniref:LytR C-terminal domain-containing protein n=1 Tax=Galactobacter sp. TaxID=2676125 RepID=UPI0025C530DC|nr:LytR C-terminal domain-containing protein [Galactobacter sp.]
MTQYPHDEFDDVPERTEREGTHREFLRVKNPRVGLWVLVACGVAVLIFGLVMFTWLRPADLNQDDDESDQATVSAPATTGQAPEGTEDATESAEPSESETPTEEATKSAEPTPTPSATETSESAEPSESPSESAEVNRSAGIGVYNSTGQSGLAAQNAGQLRSAGFTSVSNSNWTRRGDNSAVYYKSAEDEATAREVASVLNISSVAQTSNIGTDIAVVIGN